MIQQNFIHQIGDSTCITLVIVVFLLYGGEIFKEYKSMQMIGSKSESLLPSLSARTMCNGSTVSYFPWLEYSIARLLMARRVLG